jgi:hypothetical protein
VPAPVGVGVTGGVGIGVIGGVGSGIDGVGSGIDGVGSGIGGVGSGIGVTVGIGVVISTLKLPKLLATAKLPTVSFTCDACKLTV